MSDCSLMIRYVKNGFIVSDCSRKTMAYSDKEWVFESPESLASFIENWGNECLDNQDEVSTE